MTVTIKYADGETTTLPGGVTPEQAEELRQAHIDRYGTKATAEGAQHERYPWVRLRADISQDVANWLVNRVLETGLTKTEIVNEVLAKAAGLESPAKNRLAQILSVWVRANYYGKPFPLDVTLKVFERITKTPQLKGLYDEVIRGVDGKPDPELRAVLHRAIGLMVKTVLNASVVGRSNPVDPSVLPIESHALLVPA